MVRNGVIITFCSVLSTKKNEKNVKNMGWPTKRHITYCPVTSDTEETELVQKVRIGPESAGRFRRIGECR